jgi:uncharacterized protein YqjF (DUF2071 family)
MHPSPANQQRLDAREGERTSPTWTVGWREAVFQHYRVRDRAAVERSLPPGLALDLFEGDAWLSVVSFRMTKMRWLDAVPLPFASTYPQVNIRVYVVGPDGTPGVFFLRNLVSNALAAKAGRALYGMPYVYQRVSLDGGEERASCAASLPGGLTHAVEGRPGGALTGHEDDPAQLLFFLTERYPLFSERSGQLHVARMVHPPWPLRRLEGAKQSHGAVEALDLLGAVEPFDDLQCSPGVRVRMWPARSVRVARP